MAVVVLGVALVAFSRSTREEKAAPTLRDHWHAPYAIYDCDSFLPPFQSQFDPDGIHSHQDGVIHIHPFNNGVTGADAQIDVFFDAMGATITNDRITGPGIEIEAGSTCDGEETVIRAARFEITGHGVDFVEEITGDLADITFLKNLEAFTIARVPPGADIPPPPDDRVESALNSAGGGLISRGPETEVDPVTPHGGAPGDQAPADDADNSGDHPDSGTDDG